MKNFNNTKIIGIDHGYGNMKTANFCFPTGIIAYDSEPLFTADMLVYDGKYYLIGEGHKEFVPDKIKDEDYYILTLAAVAKELKAEWHPSDAYWCPSAPSHQTPENWNR